MNYSQKLYNLRDQQAQSTKLFWSRSPINKISQNKKKMQKLIGSEQKASQTHESQVKYQNSQNSLAFRSRLLFVK